MSSISSLASGRFLTTVVLSIGLSSSLMGACGGEDDRPPPLDGSGGNGEGGDDGAGGDVDGQAGLGGGTTDTGGTGTGGEGIPVGGSCADAHCEDFNPNYACYESDGVAECRCKPGFGGDDCLDINECSGDGACDANGSCSNFSGGFSCTCNAGWEASSSTTCSDRDECASDELNGCAAGADCSDDDGGYSCECPGGQYGDGFFCKAQDDCASDPCLNAGVCENTPSGYKCACPLGWSGSECQTECAVVDFDDPLVEAAVRSAIGKPDGDILPEDLQYVTILSLPQDDGMGGETVSSLAGLECWPTLQSLYVGDNDVSDLAPLANLHSLEILDLDCNPLSSLAPLASLTSLQELYVGHDGFCTETDKLEDADAAALEGLVSLTVVDLTGHELTQLGPLSALGRLQEVNATDNLIESAAGLAGLPGLRRVLLSRNLVEDVAPFASLPALEELVLDGNALSDLGALSQASSLRRLDLASNDIEDPAPLADLTDLVELDLSWNASIMSIAPLAGLTGLRDTRLSGTSVATLEPFVDNPEFGLGGEMWIGDTDLSCATEAPFMQALTARGLSFIGSCVE